MIWYKQLFDIFIFLHQGEISRKSSKSQSKLDVSGLKQFTAKRSLQV